MSSYSVPNPSRLLTITLASAFLLLSTMGFLFYQGNQLASRHAPLVDAAMEIKLEATTGHLWFEEIMSGDRNESIEAVWAHLERADWYANAMLEGGVNEEGTFYPLNDPQLRKLIISVRKKLEKFRQIALDRHQRVGTSVPGSDIDQQFDQVFHEYISEADHVESMVQSRIQQELRNYYALGSTLLVISALVTLLLSRFLHRREVQKALLIKSLSDSHEEIKKKNLELNYKAHFDQLTGLPNRVLFIDRLERLVVDSKRNDHAFALLFIDLDNFKATNDRFGHQTGDELLKIVSARIQNCIREEDTVTRLAGDEFVVMLKVLSGLDNAITAAKTTANKVLNELDQPYFLDTVKTYVTASIGISIYPVDSKNPEKLLRYADTAMYNAKSQGRNQYVFHSVEQSDAIQKKIAIEHDLRDAIQKQQLEVFYQPLWYLDSGNIHGLEALVRWRHPSLGLTLPDEFIPVAEDCGLINQIDFLVLRTSIKQVRLWREKGLDLGRLRINISPYTFHLSDFTSKVFTELTEQGIDGSDIELEITETALIQNTDRTQSVLKNLKKLGIRISIDDFGTGFSSMRYLHTLPIDTLKIDKSFTHACEGSEATDLILKNIIQLGLDLDLAVIAEGIETKTQERYLRHKGCQIGQGYLYCKPLPASEIPTLFNYSETDNIVYLNTKGNIPSDGI